ncbi:MAG: hypothetical protein ACLSAP_00980 [Oscillospiraceae bacterium]
MNQKGKERIVFAYFSSGKVWADSTPERQTIDFCMLFVQSIEKPQQERKGPAQRRAGPLRFSGFSHAIRRC